VSVIYVECWTQSDRAELYHRQCDAAVPHRDSGSKWRSRSTYGLCKHRTDVGVLPVNVGPLESCGPSP